MPENPVDLSAHLGSDSYITTYKSLDKLLNLSGPQCPHLQNGNNNTNGHSAAGASVGTHAFGVWHCAKPNRGSLNVTVTVIIRRACGMNLGLFPGLLWFCQEQETPALFPRPCGEGTQGYTQRTTVAQKA